MVEGDDCSVSVLAYQHCMTVAECPPTHVLATQTNIEPCELYMHVYVYDALTSRVTHLTLKEKCPDCKGFSSGPVNPPPLLQPSQPLLNMALVQTFVHIL